MSRIRSAFAGGRVLIPFMTCGDPCYEATERFVRAAAENGADIIELGIPFSDPTAEGPVVQGANIRALAQGVTTDGIFDMVRRIREDVTVPMVFVTYANVIFSYGAERFISLCSETGVDGLLVPDLPFEEKDEFQPICRKYGIDLIPVIAMTSADRIGMISREAEGFIYIAPGSVDIESIRTELGEIVDEIRKYTDIPCVIGVGASEQVSAAAGLADGVADEISVIELTERSGAGADVGAHMRMLRTAIGK